MDQFIINQIIEGALERLSSKYSCPSLLLPEIKGRFMKVSFNFTRTDHQTVSNNLFDTFVTLNLVQIQQHQEKELRDIFDDVVQELWTKCGRGGSEIKYEGGGQ